MSAPVPNTEPISVGNAVEQWNLSSTLMSEHDRARIDEQNLPGVEGFRAGKQATLLLALTSKIDPKASMSHNDKNVLLHMVIDFVFKNWQDIPKTAEEAHVRNVATIAQLGHLLSFVYASSTGYSTDLAVTQMRELLAQMREASFQLERGVHAALACAA